MVKLRNPYNINIIRLIIHLSIIIKESSYYLKSHLHGKSHLLLLGTYWLFYFKVIIRSAHQQLDSLNIQPHQMLIAGFEIYIQLFDQGLYYLMCAKEREREIISCSWEKKYSSYFQVMFFRKMHKALKCREITVHHRTVIVISTPRSHLLYPASFSCFWVSERSLKLLPA